KIVFIITVILISTISPIIKSDSKKDISNVKSDLLYAYTITPYDYKDCRVNFSTTHTLNIDTQKYRGKDYYISSEMSYEASQKFKRDDHVDVFGLFYILNSHTGEYIYGGITPAQNNKVNHKLLGNLFISGESQQNLNNKIILEKDIVTFQEIDFKIRKYLMDNYKIYDATSPYVSGRIEIGTKDGKHEQIDLFDSPNEGTRSDIFAKYKDNRIINMKNFSHFDIYLEK
ncbi:streptococcal pyrogenic exotoxin SpeC, partial [Streptococcus pyogenes]